MNQVDEADEPSDADYSAVDSPEEARRLVALGSLVALLMVPEEFGGDARRENVVFVPPGVAELKRQIDLGPVQQLIAEGKVTEYSVQPTYAGKCMVPTGLTITATQPSAFARHIVIWKPVSERDCD